MVNRSGSAYMIKVIVLGVILGMLAIIIILEVGIQGVEDMDTFFGDRFEKAIGVSSNFEPKILFSTFEYNQIEVVNCVI